MGQIWKMAKKRGRTESGKWGIDKGVGDVGFLGTALGLRNIFFFYTGQRGAGGLSF